VFRVVRWAVLGVGVVAVVLMGGWLAASLTTRQAPSTSRSAEVVAGSLDDLLMGLQLIPLDGQTPRPFALESLDGRRVALADLAGRPALLYFWATW
jgi:cytochrome oxidase Cu insertion factor (SCO1/SenC/PrrC family)